MNFLEKLDFMMDKLGINKSKLSVLSGVPYTTIDTFYKKGYENTKLSTIKKISDALDVSMDYLLVDTITDANYGKTNGFILKSEEMTHIKKYRLLDPYGKEAVDGLLDVESRRCEAIRAAALRKGSSEIETAQEFIYVVPRYLHPMSAGCGEPTVGEESEDMELRRKPPRGTSYIAPVNGNSMEPTYHDGDLLFIRAQEKIDEGQIGVFFMDGKQWVKELGDGVLISHNPEYAPRPMSEDIRCQGLVLGVCDESYFP